MYELASGGHAVQTHRELSTFASGEAKESQAPDRQMEPEEIQFGLPEQSTHFDPDAPDVSEQQFSASLDAAVPKPSFVVDDPEVRPEERQAISPAPFDHQPLQPIEVGEPSVDGREALHTIGEDWRDQVSAKVNHYKSRKAPKVRYPSLQLQFEPPPARVRASLEVEAEFSRDIVPQVEIPQLLQVSENLVSLEATARVIEFPRPASPPPRLDELAEALLDRPRILEAPALVPPPPALGGILIEGAREETPERRPGFDMPLRSATLNRKLLAAAVDGLLVGASLAIFGYVFLRFNGTLQPTKLSLQIAAMVMAIFWSAYQYAFLVYTGSTPGIRICGLTLARFDGSPVSRKVRRWRVLASFLSCISLGLGYAWCFFDEDQLSWHDRITKTHLAPVRPADHP
jgi:uncharacterized RDD family membrane protein YckC